MILYLEQTNSEIEELLYGENEEDVEDYWLEPNQDLTRVIR